MNKLKSKLRTASNWTKVHWIWLLSGSVTLLLAFAIFLYLSPKWQWDDWTGFGQDSTVSQEEVLQNGKFTVTKRITQVQSGKTLWDWLGLAGVIAIPVVLFQFQQQQQKKSEEQAEVEKEIAATILREEALQNYIDKIAELLIDKKLKLLLKRLSDGSLTKDDPELDAVLDVARARTSSILRRLDGDKERKNSVCLFLIEAELIKGLDLLKHANLSGININGGNFSGAGLSKANLSGAYLLAACFNKANLSKANLSGAYLLAASFSEAYLFEANFDGANLGAATFDGANLDGAKLNGANLNGAELNGANLNGAELNGANLNGANLNGANLKFVKGLTPKQIQTAINWKKAKYSSDLRKQLGLLPETAP